MTLADLLDPVTDAADLDARDFDAMDDDDADTAITARVAVYGLPARPGTVRR